MRTRSATALHHRALVGLGELHLAGLGVAAEALHLQDLALALHPLLPDDQPDEDQDDRDAEEEAGEVERRADDGADDQDCEDDECDLHEARQSICAAACYSTSRLLRCVSSRVSKFSKSSSPEPSATGRSA